MFAVIFYSHASTILCLLVLGFCTHCRIFVFIMVIIVMIIVVMVSVAGFQTDCRNVIKHSGIVWQDGHKISEA